MSVERPEKYHRVDLGGKLKPGVYEMGAAGGKRDWGKILSEFEIILAKSKGDLRTLGASKSDRKRASSELGQEGFTPGNLREPGQRSEARAILERLENTPENNRQGEDWEELQSRAEQLFGSEFSIDDVAQIYDERRAAAAVTPPAPEPEPTVERGKIFYPRIWNDLETAVQQYQRIKGVNDPIALRMARLTNNRIDKARDDLIAAGLDMSFLRERGDAARISKRELQVAVDSLSLAMSGVKIDREEVASAILYLGERGIDENRLVEMLPVPAEVEETTPIVNTPEDVVRERIDAIINRNTIDGFLNVDSAAGDLQQVRSDMTRAAARGSRIDPKDIQAIDAEIQRLVRIRAREVVAARESGVNPLKIAVDRPILGHPESSRVTLGMTSYEVRVVEPDRAFDGERLEDLMVTALEDALRAYNAAVDETTRPNLATINDVLTTLKERQKGLEIMFEESSMPPAKDLLSMAEAGKIGLDRVGLASLLAEKGIDLKKLDDGVTYTDAERLLIKSLPEYKALEEMGKAEKWVSATMEVLGFLNQTRVRGSGDKLESLASLGSDAKVSISTPSIIELWKLDRVGEIRANTETTTLTEYFERAADLEETMCRVSADGALPDPNSIGNYQNKVASLMLEFLRDVDIVEHGAKPKNEFSLMNRYAKSLSGRSLARYEAFVTTLMLDHNNLILRGNKLTSEWTKQAMQQLRREIANNIAAAETAADQNRRTTLLGENKWAAFAYSIQVGMSHALGESDKRGLRRVWKVMEPDDQIGYGASLANFEGVQYIGNLVVGEYPACTAAASVEHFAAQIMALRRRGKLVKPSTLPEVIERGYLTPSLSKTFLENTAVRLDTKVVTLESLRKTEGMSFAEISNLLQGQELPRAHAAYLKQISSAIRLRELLTCAKKEDASSLYEESLRREISDVVEAALGVEYDDPAKKKLVAGVTASIYTGLFGMLTGVTTDLTGETDADVRELIRMQGEIKEGGREIRQKIRLALYKLLYASVENGPNGGFVEKMGAPMSIEAWRMFKSIIDPSYKKLTRFGMTDEIPFVKARLIYNDPRLRAQDFWDSLK